MQIENVYCTGVFLILMVSGADIRGINNGDILETPQDVRYMIVIYIKR